MSEEGGYRSFRRREFLLHGGVRLNMPQDPCTLLVGFLTGLADEQKDPALGFRPPNRAAEGGKIRIHMTQKIHLVDDHARHVQCKQHRPKSRLHQTFLPYWSRSVNQACLADARRRHDVDSEDPVSI